jgi:hypothetical protein
MRESDFESNIRELVTEVVAEVIAEIAAAQRKPIAVSIPAAARLLGFSENHFRDRVLPDLPVIRGSRPRVLVADVQAWAEEHREPATSGAGGSGQSASEWGVSATSTRRASKPSPGHAGQARRLLEKANRSTRRVSKGGA